MLETVTDYTRMEDHNLLRAWQVLNTAEREAKEERLRIEFVLQGRMNERGASAIPDTVLDVRMDRGTPSIDLLAIQTLRELLPPEVIQEGCVEEHEETVTVPERWDQRKMNSWLKFGDEVAAVIERAKIYGEAKLKIGLKK